MTEQEMIGITNQASKEWLKEFPTPQETAHPVPKRFLVLKFVMVFTYHG